MVQWADHVPQVIPNVEDACAFPAWCSELMDVCKRKIHTPFMRCAANVVNNLLATIAVFTMRYRAPYGAK